MAQEYRIIQQGDSDFIVQKKRLWTWDTHKVIKDFNPHGPSLASIVRFPSVEKAREFIEDQRPKKASEITVVETRIIW